MAHFIIKLYALSLHNVYNVCMFQTNLLSISMKNIGQITVFSNKLSSFFPLQSYRGY